MPASEEVPAVSPSKSVKNEVHNIVQILQLTQYPSPRRFTREVLVSQDPPLLGRFRQYLRRLSAVDEFETSLSTVEPFLSVIQDPSTPVSLAAVVLGAVNKFISYNLIRVDRPGARECINSVAYSLINCRFQSSGIAVDEVVNLKIINAIVDTIRSPVGQYLEDDNVWGMVKRCFQIGRQPRSSLLLRSSSEHALQQLILKVFNTYVAPKTAEHGASYRELAASKCLRFLAFLMAYGSQRAWQSGRRPMAPRTKTLNHVAPSQSASSPNITAHPHGGRSRLPDRDLTDVERDNGVTTVISIPPFSMETELKQLASPSGPEDESLQLETRSLGLTLMNVALETGGEEIARNPRLVLVIQEHVCKALLLNAKTSSLFVLSMTLRCIFNLFVYLKKHLKVQLEIFFNSFHLQLASDASGRAVLALPHSVSTRKIKNEQIKNHLFVCEKRELALESLLEFCREPDLILELYENYDCDIRCTNIFENLVRTLAVTATPQMQDPSTIQSPAIEEGPTLSYISNSIVPDFNQAVCKSILLSHKPGLPFRKTLGRLTALHRLAFAGLCTVCQNLAFRCVWDTRGPFLRPESISSGLEEPLDDSRLENLKQQKDHKKRLAAGAKVFNTEPTSCIPALQNLGLVPTPATPDSVAEFLRINAGLDVRVIGEYLAKPGTWFADVRRSFISQIDLAGVSVVEALRVLLSCFRLPGEAQQIERILESFAGEYFIQQPVVLEEPVISPPDNPKEASLPESHRTPRWIPPEGYCATNTTGAADSKSPAQRRQAVERKASLAENPLPPPPPPPPSTDQPNNASLGPRSSHLAEATLPWTQWGSRRAQQPPMSGCTLFTTSDTVFVLAYSIIILNTDLHNPQVKKKMSCEDFVRNNRGINHEADLSTAYLASIYQSIRESEISVINSSDSTTGILENREYWDYLLKHSDFLGDYSTALNVAQVRTPLQAFHQKAMFMTLWEDAKILDTLSSVYISTRDPHTAVDCVVAFGEIIRIASFYRSSTSLSAILGRLLCFCHPVFTFKVQLVIPVIIQLLALGAVQFTFTGWTMYCDFLSRLAIIGLLQSPTYSDFDKFPIAVRDTDTLTKSFGPTVDLKSPMKPEQVHRLQQLPNSTWLSELTALLFTPADSNGLADDKRNPPSEDSDAEDNFSIPSKDVKSLHHIALETSLDFWKTCVYFPNPLGTEVTEKLASAPAVPGTPKYAEVAFESFKTIFTERCKLEELIVGRLRAASPSGFQDFACAILLQIIPPSFHPIIEENPAASPTKSDERSSSSDVADSPGTYLQLLNRALGIIGRSLESPTWDLAAARDDAPLLQGDKNLVQTFKRNFDACAALEMIVQLTLVLDQRREGVEDKAYETTFFETYQNVCTVLQGLLERYSLESEVAEASDLKEKSCLELWKESLGVDDASVLSLRLVTGALLELFTSQTAPDAEDGFFVERLVINSLKLCVSLGHHTDPRILTPLPKFFDFVCRLHNRYFYRLFFQISSAVSLLLNSAVFGQGFQRLNADSFFHLKPEDQSVAMPAFFLSVIGLIDRVSPFALHAAGMSEDSIPQLKDAALLQRLTAAGSETLSAVATSASFHAALVRLLQRVPSPEIESVQSFCVPYFTRLLVQAEDFTVSAFDMEESSLQSGGGSFDTSETGAADQAALALLSTLYAGVCAPEAQIAHPEVRTPSTNDAASNDSTEPEDLWDLWAPIAQAFAIVSAFGTRKQRRHAMMGLQHHLALMPLIEGDAADQIHNGRRWVEVVELILFPLMSQSFIYPFPSSIRQSLKEQKNEFVLGRTLLALHPEYSLVQCRIPRLELTQGLLDVSRSPFGRLPHHIVLQRRSQSVGFVCRALLGKLELLFQPTSRQTPDCLTLFPVVLRVLRVFLHEMHGTNNAMYDAVVEAAKNFLLVVGTTSQLEKLTVEDRDHILQQIIGQDVRSLVGNQTPEIDEDEIKRLYEDICAPFTACLSPAQRLFFSVIYYLLHVADRTSVLVNVFEVLMPPRRGSSRSDQPSMPQHQPPPIDHDDPS